MPDSWDWSLPWTLHPQVSLRPEPFGALLYHFGTRKLSFIKSRALLDLVESLPLHPSAESAWHAASVGESEIPAYRRALGVLAQSRMIVVRQEAL